MKQDYPTLPCLTVQGPSISFISKLHLIHTTLYHLYFYPTQAKRNILPSLIKPATSTKADDKLLRVADSQLGKKRVELSCATGP
jgi:hypothetical protein